MLIEVDIELLSNIEKDISSFLGDILNVSSISTEIADDLNFDLSDQMNVSRSELAVQVAENKIRKAAHGILGVVSLPHEIISTEKALIDNLTRKYIIVLR